MTARSAWPACVPPTAAKVAHLAVDNRSRSRAAAVAAHVHSRRAGCVPVAMPVGVGLMARSVQWFQADFARGRSIDLARPREAGDQESPGRTSATSHACCTCTISSVVQCPPAHPRRPRRECIGMRKRCIPATPWRRRSKRTAPCSGSWRRRLHWLGAWV